MGAALQADRPARCGHGRLADDLNRLRLREPQHFHPNGAAVDPDSPAGGLVAQVDELMSGLDDLGLEVEHARRLEERKREDLQEYVRQHFAAIVEALRPQAEQVATETNEAARVFAAQLDRYREHGSRIHGLCAIAQHYGDAPLARDIEGYYAAGEFQKLVRSIDLPAPTLPPRA